jgi:uncharacterized protein YodC (DUF2158 family)
MSSGTVNFKEGDQVRLKSGSPVMTVDRIDEGLGDLCPATVHTAWFDARGKLNRGVFSPEALQPD